MLSQTKYLAPNTYRTILIRLFSSGQLKPNEDKDTSVVEKRDNVAVKTKPENTFSVDMIPEKASDNFLIEFNKRKPTYDQLYEYMIDEKPHLLSKPVDNSYISPDFQLKLHHKFDFSIDAIQRAFGRLINREEAEAQKYLNRRHGILGNIHL